MCYWLVPLVTGLFLACSACYWLVPWLFRLLLTCSLLVPLVTGLFRLFRVLVTSPIFIVLVGQRGKSQKYFDLSAFKWKLNHSNLHSTDGDMNFQKWELLYGSPDHPVLSSD